MAASVCQILVFTPTSTPVKRKDNPPGQGFNEAVENAFIQENFCKGFESATTKVTTNTTNILCQIIFSL